MSWLVDPNDCHKSTELHNFVETLQPVRKNSATARLKGTTLLRVAKDISIFFTIYNARTSEAFKISVSFAYAQQSFSGSFNHCDKFTTEAVPSLSAANS